jgi:uncharacterized OB-fold protein
LTGEADLFWEGVNEDRLVLTRCALCGELQHPPTPMCPACGSLEWIGADSRGRGTVLSWIVSHHPSAPDDRARIVALVELEEGARLVSNLVDLEVADVANDMKVEVVFRDVDGVRLPQFRATSDRST